MDEKLDSVTIVCVAKGGGYYVMAVPSRDGYSNVLAAFSTLGETLRWCAENIRQMDEPRQPLIVPYEV